MMIFSLLVYSCVSYNAPLSGELLSKTCNWTGGGSFYVTKESCEAAAPAIGSPIYSDVADGRKVEGTRCQEIQVYR